MIRWSRLWRDNLPALILLSLPLVFFFATSATLSFSAFYILRNPSNPQKITKNQGDVYSIFTAVPDVGDATLGESLVGVEARSSQLQRYLEVYRSPLASSSDLILSVSDKYHLDWRLLTAIAGQESTFGKNVPEDSHNAWGWGIHSRGVMKFSSWEQAIEVVGESLREDFLDQGAETLEELMQKWAPLSDGSWAFGVNYFMNELESGDF